MNRSRATALNWLPVAALLIVSSARGTEAAPIVFTDRVAFDAAAGPNILVTFDTVEPNRWAPQLCFFIAISCDYIVDGVLHVESLSFTDNHALVVGSALNLTPEAIASVDVGGPITAFGFNALPAQVSPEGQIFVDWIVNGVRESASTHVGDSTTFFGLLFPDPVSGVRLGAIPTAPPLFARFASIDNVAITSVPEPSTALLLGLGLVGVCWRGRKAT
jgi:PEP-CTERM motif-containing protein